MKKSVIISVGVLALAALALCCSPNLFLKQCGDEVVFRWTLAELSGHKPLQFLAYFTTADSPELSESKVVRADYRGDVPYTIELPDSITSLRLDVKIVEPQVFGDSRG